MIRYIYYSLWADAINYERLKNGGENHWKLFTFSYMSVLMSLNIFTLLSVILYFTDYNLGEKLMDWLMQRYPNEGLANFFWGTLIGFLPSFIITYFFIFFNRKYEYILKNYKFRKGKLLVIYFFLSGLAFFGFSLLNKFK